MINTIKKKRFNYADSIISEYSTKPMDRYFSDQIPSRNGLFFKFNIITTPYILISKNDIVYLFNDSEIFNKNNEINIILKNLIESLFK